MSADAGVPEFKLEGVPAGWPQEAEAARAFLSNPRIVEASRGTLWGPEGYLELLIEAANTQRLGSAKWLGLMRGRPAEIPGGAEVLSFVSGRRESLAAALGGQDGRPLELPAEAHTALVEALVEIVRSPRRAATRLGPEIAARVRGNVVLIPDYRVARKASEERHRVVALSPAAILNYCLMQLLRRDSATGTRLARCKHCSKFFVAWRSGATSKGKLNRRWCRECHASGVGRRAWETTRKAAARRRDGAKHK